MSNHLVHVRNLDDSLKAMIIGSKLTEEEFKTFMSGYFNKANDKMTMLNLDEEIIQYFTELIESKKNSILDILKEYRLKNDDIELSELNRDIVEKIENNSIDINILKNLLSDGNSNININELKETLQQLSNKMDNFTVTEGSVEELTTSINEKYNAINSSITQLTSEINNLDLNVRKKDVLIEASDLSQTLKDTISNSAGNNAVLDSIYRRKEDLILESDLGASLQAKLTNIVNDLDQLEKKIYERIKEKEQEIYSTTKDDIDVLSRNFKENIDELEETIRDLKKAMFNKIIDITLRPNEVYKIPCENPYAYDLKVLVEEDNENSICYGQYIDASAITAIGISTKESFTGYSICNILNQSINLRIVYSKKSIQDSDLYFPEQSFEELEETTEKEESEKNINDSSKEDENREEEN